MAECFDPSRENQKNPTLALTLTLTLTLTQP